MLPERDLLDVVRHAPLVAIDLLLRRADGALLLGLRANQPAKGQWFVPGGRIRKNESIEEAFARLTHAELGQSLPLASATFRGVFSQKYDTNFLGAPGIDTHSIVLAYELSMTPEMASLPTEQHTEYAWWTGPAAAQSPLVHTYTRGYFLLDAVAGRA